jgi:hypothetical protein
MRPANLAKRVHSILCIFTDIDRQPGILLVYWVEYYDQIRHLVIGEVFFRLTNVARSGWQIRGFANRGHLVGSERLTFPDGGPACAC